MSKILQFVLTLLCVGIVLNVCAMIVGVSPSSVYRQLYATLHSSYGCSQIAFKATPIILIALGACVSFRTGLWNIGFEGQLVIASLATGIVGGYLPSNLPGSAGILILLLVACSAGAAWALIAGLLKTYFSAPEVMTTIMLNFIAMAISSWMMQHFATSESNHTIDLAPQFRFSTFAPWIKGSQLNTIFLMAIALTFVLHWFLFRTKTGFSFLAYGENPRAATLYGTSKTRTILLVFLVSGILCGIAACHYVLGSKGFHEDGFSGGVGFVGLAAALVAFNRPLLCIASGILFGALAYASLAINVLIPKEVTDVLTAATMIVILMLANGDQKRS